MKLPVSLTIRELRGLKPEWLTAIDDAELRIDCSAVEAVDTAGLQMLLALRASRATAGGTTAFDNPSAALRGASQALGLESALGLTGP